MSDNNISAEILAKYLTTAFLTMGNSELWMNSSSAQVEDSGLNIEKCSPYKVDNKSRVGKLIYCKYNRNISVTLDI